jgi:hypothetical protein
MSYYNTPDSLILMMHAWRIAKEIKKEVAAAYAKSHLTQYARDDLKYAE